MRSRLVTAAATTLLLLLTAVPANAAGRLTTAQIDHGTMSTKGLRVALHYDVKATSNNTLNKALRVYGDSLRAFDVDLTGVDPYYHDVARYDVKSGGRDVLYDLTFYRARFLVESGADRWFDAAPGPVVHTHGGLTDTVVICHDVRKLRLYQTKTHKTSAWFPPVDPIGMWAVTLTAKPGHNWLVLGTDYLGPPRAGQCA